MAEFQHHDIAGRFLDGLTHGRQMRAMDEQRQDRLTLRDLAAGAIGGDPSAQAQAYAIDPTVGKQYAEAGDQKAMKMRGMAKYMQAAIERGNPQEIEQVYQSLRPHLAQFNPQAPPTFTPDMAANIQKVLATTAWLEQPGKPQGPMNVSPGGVVIDPATGREIYANRNFAPRAPQNPVWDSVRGGWVMPPDLSGGAPMGAAPQMPQGAPQGGPQVPPMQLAAIFQKFGGTLTSAFRNPAKNAQVRGVRNSYHLTGQALDFVFPTPQVKAQAMAMAQSAGYEAIDEGDHVHFEPPGSPQSAAGGAGFIPVVPPKSQERSAPAGYEWQADGSLRPIIGGPADPSNQTGNKLKDPTEDMNKAAAWHAQAENAYRNLMAVYATNPDALIPGFLETYSPIDELGNRSRSPERQKAAQAGSSLAEALLRAATGAGVTQNEAEQKVRELTPQRGDDEAVIQQKLASIPVYLESLKNRAGRAIKEAPQSDQARRAALLDKY